MQIRTLREAEREAWLDLLDGWELGDWRGRDFFRRFIDHDPSYADENVWVAEEGGDLLAAVQIFPREIRLAGHAVPVGGIGSVFTRESARQRGLGGALLDRAAEAMRERGHEISLLFSGRVAWYTKLGWRSWGVDLSVLTGEQGRERSGGSSGAEIVEFDVSHDLADVRQMNSVYGARRDGTVIRDEGLWSASLRLSGNPDEEFLVARSNGHVVAYARATRLSGVIVLMELGRTDHAAPELALLMERLRAGAPAATPDLRHDPELAGTLEELGVRVGSHPHSGMMFRCLDEAALSQRLGRALEPGESAEAFLLRVLPAAETVFWPADRF